MSKNLNHLPSRKKIAGATAGGFATLSYLAGVLRAGFKTYNPITILVDMFRQGFPLGYFVLLLVVFGSIAGYYYLMNHRDGTEKDVLGRNFFRSTEKQTYGDVHFETPREFEPIALVQSADKAFGTILGQMDDTGKRLINQRMDRSRDNHNIMVVGASGTGKSFTFTKPFCYQAVKRRESVIITDPDGGLYRDMAGYFQDQGYVVRRLDYKNMLKSDGWDCLKIVRSGGDIGLKAQMFANAVISNIGEGKGNDIYSTGSMTLLKACILRVLLGPDFPEEKKNIATVYSLIQNPAGEAFLDSVFDEYSLPEEAKPCIGPYMSFKQASSNLRGNIVTHLAVGLQLLQNEVTSKVLSTDDIDVELPAKQPCAYFCLFPDSEDSNQFLVAMFFSMLFIGLIDYADNSPDGRCPVPVNFLLDEFPSIGKLPDFNKKMATIRKRAIQAVLILQDITQLRNNYPTTWVTLMSNCATFISLGINDGETATLLEKRVGTTSVMVETEQQKTTEAVFSIFKPKSVGVGQRKLLSYDELFRVDEDSVVILAQKHNPIYARKYPHILHPDSKKLRTILPSEIPDITDTAARAEKKAKEDAFVVDYLAKHPLSEVDRSYAKIKEPSPAQSIFEMCRNALADCIKAIFNLQFEEELLPWEQTEQNPDSITFLEVEGEEVPFELADTSEPAPIETQAQAPAKAEPAEQPAAAKEIAPPEVQKEAEAPAPVGKAPQTSVQKATVAPQKEEIRKGPPSQVLSPDAKGLPGAMFSGVGHVHDAKTAEREAIGADAMKKAMQGYGRRTPPKKRGGTGTAYSDGVSMAQKKPPTQATDHTAPPSKKTLAMED